MAAEKRAGLSQPARDLYLPEFQELDEPKKAKLVAGLRSRWPFRPSETPALPKHELLEIVREQHGRHHQLCDEGARGFLTVLLVTTMKSSDLLAMHEHGVPNVNEVAMTMAELVLRLNRPILHRYGFSEDLAGLAQMDQMVFEHLGDPAIADAVAQHQHDLVFGRAWDVEELEQPLQTVVKITAHIVWMSLLSPGAALLGQHMSYLHHLALPPLERRLRSYGRTIAFAEGILAPVLQLLRQERAAKQLEGKRERRDRIVWVFGAEDHDLGRLARGGYFEDAAAFKPELETLQVFLISARDGAEFAGTWPCGEHAKVHLVTDHRLLAGGELPEPELAFLFNMNPEDVLQCHRVVSLLFWAKHAQRPVCVITVRCEAQARRLYDFLDMASADLAWPFEQTPQHQRRDSRILRNLYSGMAGSPDIEYDDNGWMTAVVSSRRGLDMLARWTDDIQAFHHDLWRHFDLCKQRWRWTQASIEHLGSMEGLLAQLGGPRPGDDFGFLHLTLIQHATSNANLMVAELVEAGFIEVVSEESEEEAAAAAAREAEGELEAEEPQEDDYRVVHSMVMIRSEASTASTAVGMHKHGTVVRGAPVRVDGERWLRISHARQGRAEAEEAWMLMDGRKLGLGVLLERAAPPPKEQAASDGKDSPAGDGQDCSARTQRSPVVFWGILDLKYDSRKFAADQVKVLETGDGRLSRFSGCGASIKESFQQDHKLEATLRRAVITENKKLTHDVIVGNGYGHIRPRQLEFRREYEPALADRIKEAFSFDDGDLCVLKLCNRARGAGVIPVPVAELDEYLQELLRPPTDLEAWISWQPRDWWRKVTSDCFEEQVRHWWSNEAPLFLVEEFCMSMPTERDERYYDGTMRVGFSLHREHRDRLPPGWVDSPNGPVRVHSLEGDEAEASQKAPPAWNDTRPYMDLFRPETSILRVQWLGGYWKLPVEDVTSQDLRRRIVSVAKEGTAPVPEHDLHAVYAALGDMVPLLFGANDLRPQSIKERYKAFPELGSFLIARLACSVRGADKVKCGQLLELARMLLEKGSSPCKDFVASYIHRNVGVAEAMNRTQWEAAAEHFRKSLQKLPTNANSRHLLGLSYLEIGSPRKAVEVLEAALLLDPDAKAPYACLGVARLQLAQYAEAEDVSRAGLARHPHTPACQYNLGVACFALAVLEEHERGGGHVASELRERALTALEIARDKHFRENTWEVRDDAIVAQLRDGRRPLAWSERKLPQDGWRVMGWRP